MLFLVAAVQGIPHVLTVSAQALSPTQAILSWVTDAPVAAPGFKIEFIMPGGKRSYHTVVGNGYSWDNLTPIEKYQMILTDLNTGLQYYRHVHMMSQFLFLLSS